MSFFLIGHDWVTKTLDMLPVIREVERAYLLKTGGKGGVFPVITHEWEPGVRDMDIKAGFLDGDINIYGLKALTYMEGNSALGLPPLSGTMLLFNSLTGQLLGILDSRAITGYRTGAAGGIGSKYLARRDSKTLLLVGAGNQALFNLAANLLVMEHLQEVLVFDPLSPAAAERFAREAPQRLRDGVFGRYRQRADLMARLEVSFEAAADLETAVGRADIIVTTTPSREPLIRREWLRAGVHLNCVGADMEGKEEVDPEIFAVARVVVDDIGQAVALGESEIPVKTGVIAREDILCEIGEVIAGGVQGRRSDADITLFDTTGLALQDLVTAKYLLDMARRDNLPGYQL